MDYSPAPKAPSPASTKQTPRRQPIKRTTNVGAMMAQIGTKQAPEVPPAERVQHSYKQLSLAAASLNAASDELGKAISLLDASLKSLNLGVTSWVTLSENQEENHWWQRDIGYTKIRDKWGIALRTSSGDFSNPDMASEEKWPFNDAPRWMRIEAVGKIPDLLEALVRQAEDTTRKIQKKTEQAFELTTVIQGMAGQGQSAEQK